MNHENFLLNANPLVAYFQKSPREFTKADIMRYIAEHGIRMVNFLYPAGDGRLKTLNFVITDRAYLDTILSCGERVDGSSLFRFIGAGSSDLYVLPRFSTAFVDPFAEIPTLCLLCSYFDKDGRPLASSSEQTLLKAAEAFREVTGMEFEAMGELEYYVIKPDEERYPAVDQRAYHESAPFAKTNAFRAKCMLAIAQTGAQIKYGHSEVGNFAQDGLVYEQNEIEFLPVPVREAADQLVIAKWIIRNLAYEEGLNVTFAPKITTGKAGSGLHVHMRITRNGDNLMLDDAGKLSNDARRLIAGLVDLAPALTAFGNKNPTSYFRLVPHQEAPTNVCWGDRNRSVLVRVPLGGRAMSTCVAKPIRSKPPPCATRAANKRWRSAMPTVRPTSINCWPAFVWRLATALKCPMPSKWHVPPMSMSTSIPPIRPNSWSASPNCPTAAPPRPIVSSSAATSSSRTASFRPPPSTARSTNSAPTATAPSVPTWPTNRVKLPPSSSVSFTADSRNISSDSLPDAPHTAEYRDFFSKSKSICADSSGLPRDFALYGRRRAAGKGKVVFYQAQR